MPWGVSIVDLWLLRKTSKWSANGWQRVLISANAYRCPLLPLLAFMNGLEFSHFQREAHAFWAAVILLLLWEMTPNGKLKRTPRFLKRFLFLFFSFFLFILTWCLCSSNDPMVILSLSPRDSPLPLWAVFLKTGIKGHGMAGWRRRVKDTAIWEFHLGYFTIHPFLSLSHSHKKCLVFLLVNLFLTTLGSCLELKSLHSSKHNAF